MTAGRRAVRAWVAAAAFAMALPAGAQLQKIAQDRIFAGRGGTLVLAGVVPDVTVERVSALALAPSDDSWEPDRLELILWVRANPGGGDRVVQRLEVPPLPAGSRRLVAFIRDSTTFDQTELLNIPLEIEPELTIEPSKSVLAENETFHLRSRFRAIWGGSPAGYELDGNTIRTRILVACFFNCPFSPPIRDFDLEGPPLGPFPPGEYELEVRNAVEHGGMLLHRQKIVVVPREALVRDGRFSLAVALDPLHGGTAKLARRPSADAALFYFFEPENWEIQVKVLDGCELNGRYWVYAAASTDVGYTLSVRDTLRGTTREYRHAAGSPAPAVTDDRAFACGGPEEAR